MSDSSRGPSRTSSSEDLKQEQELQMKSSDKFYTSTKRQDNYPFQRVDSEQSLHSLTTQSDDSTTPGYSSYKGNNQYYETQNNSQKSESKLSTKSKATKKSDYSREKSIEKAKERLRLAHQKFTKSLTIDRLSLQDDDEDNDHKAKKFKKHPQNRYCIVEVFDKTGLLDFIPTLINQFGFTAISSGTTLKYLKKHSIQNVIGVDELGLDGDSYDPCSLLQPKVYHSILENTMKNNNIPHGNVELVIANLLPFADVASASDTTVSAALDIMDYVTPSLLRTAIKSHTHVTILTDVSQYDDYAMQLLSNPTRKPTLRFNQQCARDAAWALTLYDWSVAAYMTRELDDRRFPHHFSPLGIFDRELRYGENIHQTAAFYRTGGRRTGWAESIQLQGKDLSYNNMLDLEVARSVIAEYDGFTMDRFDKSPAVCVIVKHANPCAVALAETSEDAYIRAYNADPVSAYGAVVALNRTIDRPLAKAITKFFLECVVAPDCQEDALEVLQKKSKMRVLLVRMDQRLKHDIRYIAGGFLLQTQDATNDIFQDFELVTNVKPSQKQQQALMFAWKAVKHVKSNAVVVASPEGHTIGVGAGQPNRVGAMRLALELCEETSGAVLASDGFFHFDDSLRMAIDMGIRAIIQPGGSLHDQDMIDLANEHGIAMVFTKIRHFIH